MPRDRSGKIIFVNGPSFAGKTRFVMTLINEFPEIKTVTFESFYKSKWTVAERMIRFYEEIRNKSNAGQLVVAESVRYHGCYPYQPHIFKSFINVLVLPSSEVHQKRYDEYVEKFGERQGQVRIGWPTLTESRSRFMKSYMPEHSVCYDGTNLDGVLGEIKQYVGNR